MPRSIATPRLAFVSRFALALTAAASLTATTIASPAEEPAHASIEQSAEVDVPVVSATLKSLPVRLEVAGVVSPVRSIAVRSRIESEIAEVHFEDGSDVRQGDLLFTLDDHTIRIEIRRVQAVLAAEKARLDQAERDVIRAAELLGRNAGTAVALANARTQVAILRATAEASEATLEKLNAELEFTKIRAPISGRITVDLGHAGNLTRFSDSGALATIVQMVPTYVAFTVTQSQLPEFRRALRERSEVAFVAAPGTSPLRGRIVMVDDVALPKSGMTTVRAVVTDDRDGLWPHMPVTVQLTARHEPAIVVPASAVRTDMAGAYAYVVEAGHARMRRIKVARIVGGEAVLEDGLRAGEQVVTGDHLKLADNVRIAFHAMESRS